MLVELRIDLLEDRLEIKDRNGLVKKMRDVMSYGSEPSLFWSTLSGLTTMMFIISVLGVIWRDRIAFLHSRKAKIVIIFMPLISFSVLVVSLYLA